MRISCLALILCFASEPSIQDSYGLHRNNQTENYPQGNFTKPGERYRRLVPYMTYYLVGNNNVENQPPRTDKYEKIRTPPRKPQFHIRPRERNKQQTKNEPFLPSVQYDPKDTGPNKAYFTPIRYGMKLNQRDYSSNTRPVHSRPAPGNIVPETKFYKTETPNLPKQNYLPFRQTLKTVPTNIDYFLDYEPQSLGNQQSSYDYDLPFDEFESFRYATPAPDKPEYVNTINSQANNHLKVPVSELDHIVKSLQLSNHLPEMLNKDNIDSSIRTLVEILNILHNARSQPPRQQQQQEVQLQEHEVTNPKLKSKPPDYGFHEDFPRPHQVLQTNYYVTPNIRPQFQSQPIRNENTKATYYVSEQPARDKYKPIFPHEQTVDNQAHKQHSENTLENERFRYPINNEKTRDNYPLVNNGQKDNTENIPPSLKYGATRGKPHVDYPAYSTIPLTNFNCKQQRYKGFFGDPATRCQVWHYCDLNGGKSSFLCPNGTIFNQVALTCDWWFNVKCESTTQLYVLNERLYKYILPVMPKFPEDFTGPEVDRYLEQKFKEIEAKLQEKKLKQEQEEKNKTQESLKNEMLSENNTE